jgi:hypothetical protein
MIKFIKAQIWSGAGWLLALCVILTSVVVIYLVLHARYPGTDHKQLDTMQLANIDNLLSAYPDTIAPKVKNDTSGKSHAFTSSQREKRDKLIFAFLKNQYDCSLDTLCLKPLDQVLLGLNVKDAKLYLTSKEIIVIDFFWFTGSRTYLEVLFWALVGVLVSLLYYVSIADGLSLKTAGDPDSGSFDPSEISGQVAKMFYAPVCALVLVLGYNLLSADNKMTDISIGKGLLLFSFICGFFSGRVMKFIDQLKNIVLPISSNGAAGNVDGAGKTAPITPANASDISVKLQLAPAVAQSPAGAGIAEGGFNTATVTLQPAAGGNSITLQAPTADQGDTFTTKQLPYGKFTLTAMMNYNNAGTVINLSASQDIEVSATTNSFDVPLDKTAATG